ncbi:hypothetical protein WJX72_010826 [[Myrmecia] bisecta]|uniref:Dynein heavy chain n=1 Tax=[Myrmecia] bisecta TaxID=41462 RepID=A0AAW1P383_9CHLO
MPGPKSPAWSRPRARFGAKSHALSVSQRGDSAAQVAPQKQPDAQSAAAQQNGRDDPSSDWRLQSMPASAPTAAANGVAEPEDDWPHLQPKLLAALQTRPGETPRGVQIQRKRRLFAMQSLPDLLSAEGVDLTAGRERSPASSILGLEIFDDTDYESRTAAEWVPRIPGAPKTPAKVAVYHDDGSCSWEDCAVTDYDEPSNAYLVEVVAPAPLQGGDSTGGGAGPPHVVMQWVPRINLYFKAEDPFVFAKRVAAAHRSKAHAEALLRYHLCVDSMPTDDIPPLTMEQINRMLGFALNSKKLKDKLMDTSQLINETNIEYARTMNKIVFDATIKAAAQGKPDLALVPLKPSDFPLEAPCQAPGKGTVDVPAYDFPEQFSEFSFRSLLTKAEVVMAAVKVRTECNKVLKMNLCQTHFAKSSRVEEFEAAQAQAADQTANYLKEAWLAALKTAIRNSFKDIGKGWYNLNEANYETYQFSKLKRFLLLVRFVMEDTLRSCVEDNLARFAAFVRAACSTQVTVKDLASVEVVDAAGGAARKPPLFSIELVLRDNNTFGYSSDLDALVPKFLAVVERAITSTQGIQQLEPLVMEKMFWATKPTLGSVHPQEPALLALKDSLSATLAGALAPLRSYLALFQSHEHLLQLDIAAYVGAWEARSEELTMNELRGEINKHLREAASLKEAIPSTVHLGLAIVNCSKVREALVEKKGKLIRALKEVVARVPRSIMVAVGAKYSEIDKRLRARVGSIEEVDEQRQFIDALPRRLNELGTEAESTKVWYSTLEQYRYLLPEEDAKEKLAGEAWPAKIQRSKEVALQVLEVEQGKCAEQMSAEQSSFANVIVDLDGAVAKLQTMTDLSTLVTTVEEVKRISAKLKQAEKDAQLYNSREALFGKVATDYSQLRKIADAFEPFHQFWTTMATWKERQHSWLYDPLDKMVGEAVEKEVAAALRTLAKTGKVLTQRGLLQPAANCEAIRAEIEDFQKLVPLVMALRNPGMRERHWAQLSAELAMPLNPDKSFTLTKAQEMNLLASLDVISKVADVAGKEWSIEVALDKMAGEWEGAELGVLDYRDTGTCVVKLDEALLQQLDDHMVMAQSMSFSPYKKPFEERLARWEAQMALVSETLEEWLALQRAWMYLEPIFSSADILQQLPLEGKRFASVDRLWRKSLAAAKASPGVLKVCSSQKLLDQFVESNKLLESVQKGLADYLETKRLAFARFFFLSNDELLQILSQAKNPLAVQPHLRKCFEAIESLDFSDGLDITAMNSKEGEKVQFDQIMQPTGAVEVWLGEVERRMRGSVRSQIEQSMADYCKRPRPDWVRRWPAMVVLAVSAIFWSKNVEEGIRKGNVDAVLERCTTDLLDLTDLVRGKLSAQDRLTLGALITIDVHARDVVQQLVDAKVARVTDFEWVSQLRYYWRNDVWVEMVQASLAYGYEYLGNTPRLVITPLTDRCYMTLMGAMHLNLGGAPAGPAGTGKTETTKDLAKAMAKQCVVFNCSDGLDYIAMAKFFKGLASSGAWACFDEFNRIDLEVLSVVAQQILTIQLAIQAKVQRFVFEDTEISLDPSCSVYITMNPGYAGRSELPDNLKALFRPCAMMVPDYALIAEICLYSYGYRNAKNLARKMVATFKLCSEQLSSQDHYDYGMRAVKSVITAAGNLKREFPDASEDVLLLRGLRDVNVPKFLAHDLPLFAGIITDLFPGIAPPKVDYDDLLGAVHEACAELGLQPVEAFVAKVIQLYETTLVRHGLMLVGPTMGGKTAAYRTLQKAMSKLCETERFEKVRVVALNPKAITMGQLYGEFDENTHEWTDGVLATYMRECCADTKPDKKWIMFDGPVDALWIENMNTVLDDNKKLCLVSGEIIQLTDAMTMMFEVEDLAVASPATVSRCGMVYLEPTSIGTQPLLASWLAGLPPGLKSGSATLASIFQAIVPEAVRFVRKNLAETVATVDHGLVASCFNVMDAMLRPYVREEGKEALTADEAARLQTALPSLMLFAIVWSVGASCDKRGRIEFDIWLRHRVTESGLALPGNAMFPREKNVYEWCFDQTNLTWVEWMATVPEFVPNADAPFASIIVPTADTVRYTFLLKALAGAGKHVLCVGDTGTGKTLNIMEQLMKGNGPEMVPVFMTFSARTSANQTQDLIDSKMEKRRKGVIGPPSGQKYVIFVDDLNMPQREKYGAQPPIELLRQWMDHKGWYDRRPPCAFKQIVDTQFVAAMGPPGGGRNPVTARFLRHFNMLSFTDMSDESVGRIFTTILGAFAAKHFNERISEVVPALIASTVDIYNSVRAELLPTPSKPHYTFNLRDVARVVQGIMRADPKSTAESRHMLSLWLHESARVFADRFVNEDDHAWFRQKQKLLLMKHFNKTWDEVTPSERIIYGDYIVPGADPRPYTQIADMAQLVKVIEEYLEEYNAGSSAPMKLVMFLDAIEHVSRVSRVVRQPQGHALLLGVGGSGRQSLARLAAHMQDLDVVQIEIAKGYGANEWREDLKRLVKRAGLEGRETLFLFTDTQIVMESFLEDINNLLNSGEVPNMMRLEDQEEIASAMRPLMQAAAVPTTKNNINAFFVDRVRANLHLVLCMSPIGDAFRQRLRMFPALVNCCTIDWFREWPKEALASVATNFFQDVPLSNETYPELALGVVRCCVALHQAVERKSRQFTEELRRFTYVTPTSYLELLTTFMQLLTLKRQDIGVQKRRLEIGLDKLLTTAAQVEVMQKELQQLQPVLEQTAQEVEAMMVTITADKKEADETKKAVAKQEVDANVQAAKAKEIAADAQRDLDEALPALEAATASLKNLSRNDVVEVKSLSNPPAGVKLVMEATCIMFDEKPKMVDDPNKMGKKVPNYWDTAKKLLNDPSKFLDSLLTYDKDNIPESVITKIEPYIQMPEFTTEYVAKVSKACTSICMWVRAMHLYHTVALGVAPKRAALAAAQAQLDNTLKQLAEAQAKLAAVEAKIQTLETQYAEATTKKGVLAKQVAECTVKLARAEKLIGGLGGEKSRWQATTKQLAKDMENVVGDVVVAAGTIAYSGPFTPLFRQALVDEWTNTLRLHNVPHTPNTNIIKTLQDPVKMRAWNLAGLPTDSVSMENGIIVSRARRWPLMIDPQGQANKWIKNMERANGLDVVKLTEKDFLRTLENGVRFGRPVLMENIGETLDAALEPLLLKQTFKQGGSEVIKIGDNIIPYHADFRFYMTTKLRNPHYSPEVAVKVALLNFFVTPEGLEEQLLDITVTQERPDLSEMKTALMVGNARMRGELSAIEDKILQLLSTSQGNILDDEVLINTLAVSKATSNEIAGKVEEAERTEVEIDAAREQYRRVAVRASLLFFCIADLAGVDPMYQYSLASFITLFLRTITTTPQAESVEKRGRQLNEAFTLTLYINTCRSLFEKHKLMFSFLLAIKILQNRQEVDSGDWRFLLAGATVSNASQPNPAPAWLTEKAWLELLTLQNLPAFQGFASHVAENLDHYHAIFDSEDAHAMPLLEPWQSQLSAFQKLCFLRCIRPDKVTRGIQRFVGQQLGAQFTEPPPFELSAVFRDSSPTAPLIFVLSPGADPMADLLKLADDMKFSKKFEKVSLGQGQGPKAERVLEMGMERGLWVCLQNCHLAVSWMPALERIVEAINPDTCHKDFRLWLTSMPSPNFPAAVLQSGIKMTLEPPKGLKANLLRSYTRFSDAYLHECAKPAAWRRLVFGMCLFHAVVQDRRKFGPLGWNIRYDFTDGDLNVSLTQMRMFLDEYDEIPFRVLRFLFTEINYGGRVTDDKDRRLISNMVHTFVDPTVCQPGHQFSPSGTYTSIDFDTAKEYLEHIKAYPAAPKPEIFGLHENADITCDQNETYEMFSTVLSLQPRVSSGTGVSRDDTIMSLCESILAQVPALFDVDEVSRTYPTTYKQSMNTVLAQECIRYNGLLAAMGESLRETIKALKGLVAMSPALEAVANSIFDNQVPELWANKAYPSLKPLSSWVVDLLERDNFVRTWIRNGVPPVYWISGFFFPQAFLTGTVQNFARKYTFPIDTVSFEFQVMDELSVTSCQQGPEDGCYIRGLYMEGASWQSDTHRMGESRPKELFTEMPIIWLRPVQHRVPASVGTYYNCPVYKTLTRAGTLSTTGHSTNFVMYIEVPSSQPESHWINRGVALFTSLAF